MPFIYNILGLFCPQNFTNSKILKIIDHHCIIFEQLVKIFAKYQSHTIHFDKLGEKRYFYIRKFSKHQILLNSKTSKILLALSALSQSRYETL